MKATYLLPIALTVLIVIFFAGLPALQVCPPPKRIADDRRGWRSHWFILALTLVYTLVAFVNLGDTRAPQSFRQLDNEYADIELANPSPIGRVMLYTGIVQGSYTLQFSPDGETWIPAANYEQGHASLLKWEEPELFAVPEGDVRTVRVIGYDGAELGEVALFSPSGERLEISCGVTEFCDEQALVPETPYFLNSSYFDEIYHARTAWEHLRGMWPYEISHPPLGKEILSLGILLFGMTPFGWRFMGTLFGAAMLPLLYLFLKKLFGSRAVSAAGTALFALDFMHYAQTRIATIDTYSVFFILLMYLFLYLWLSEDRLWALAACGISFGLGAAAKWTSIYAGAGLAVIWAGHWLLRFFEARGQEERDRGLFPAFLKNAAFCVVFFILVPCLIYYLSYLPYGAALGQRPFTAAYTRTVLDNQRYMFSYHVGVTATHPYSSRWYQWLLNIRPILYYLDYLPDGRKVSIAAFLNPMLCWGGLLSLFVAGYLAFARRSRVAAFLLVGYLAELLPWIFIQRLTFAYHYFPSSLFLVLTLSLCFDLLRRGRADWKLPVWGYVALAGLLFAVFFPTLNGLPIQPELASRLMKWLPTWPL